MTLQLKRSRHKGASTVALRSCSDRVAREIVRSRLIDPCSKGRSFRDSRLAALRFNDGNYQQIHWIWSRRSSASNISTRPGYRSRTALEHGMRLFNQPRLSIWGGAPVVACLYAIRVVARWFEKPNTLDPRWPPGGRISECHNRVFGISTLWCCIGDTVSESSA